MKLPLKLNDREGYLLDVEEIDAIYKTEETKAFPISTTPKRKWWQTKVFPKVRYETITEYYIEVLFKSNAEHYLIYENKSERDMDFALLTEYCINPPQESSKTPNI